MKVISTKLPIQESSVSAATARLSVIGAALVLLASSAYWSSREVTFRKQLSIHPVQLADDKYLKSPLTRIRLYVGVLSKVTNLGKRMAIRQTWGADAGLERVVFVVANPAYNSTLLQSLRQEALKFRDLIIVGHVVESYYNIAYQTLEVFKSASAYFGDITHVMKCDDDSYVRVDKLLEFLAQHPFDSTFLGRMWPVYEPIRNINSLFYVSRDEWPKDKANITWAHGGPGYILTRDLAYEVATTAAYMCSSRKFFKLEDVALASWLLCLQQKLGVHVNVVHDSRFNADDQCAHDDIVSHRISATQMMCMFASNGSCC